MSRNRSFHGAHVIDTYVATDEADHWDTDTVEPAGFNDHYLAVRHTVPAGSHFPGLDPRGDDDWEF